MYLEHFGLSDYPFDGLPDHRFYYVGGAQHQSLGLLMSALSRSGSICVLSGPSGAGKTTLVRMLMRSLPKSMRIITIDDPRTDPHMLLATILRASGVVATSLESIADLTLKLRQMLEHSIAQGVITTVICDEAQGLSDDVLEQIRFIFNIEGEAGKMINFLLVGQNELIAHLDKPEHEMLKNRIKIFAQLPPLKQEEVTGYLSYRLQQVGCNEPLFTQHALSAITKKSLGLPRAINAIADMSLTLAAQKNKNVVDAVTVKRAAHLVRFNKVGLKQTAKTWLRELCSGSFYARIAVVVGAAACAFGAFFGAIYLNEHYHPVLTMEEALISDSEVKERYQNLSSYLFQGRHAQSRELYLFNQAIAQAYFKSEAFATLFKLHGYAVIEDNGDGTITDDVLAEVKLQSLSQNGTFAEAVSYNTPIVIGLIDDNLTPFYAVLYQISDDIGQLIIGDYMFDVKLSYLQERYQGSFTLLYPYVGDLNDLKSRTTDVRKAMQKVLSPYLESYRQLALESTNREANLALTQYDEQQAEVERARIAVRQELINQVGTGKSDSEIEAEVTAQLDAALAEDPTYQAALVDMLAAEQKSTELEERALRIRSISLLLNDGFERALQLYLDDQNITELTTSAVALLTLRFSEGPRLINVVPQQVNEPTANIGLDLEQIEAQAQKKADDAKLTQAGDETEGKQDEAQLTQAVAQLTKDEAQLTQAASALTLVVREGGAC